MIFIGGKYSAFFANLQELETSFCIFYALKHIFDNYLISTGALVRLVRWPKPACYASSGS